MLRRGLLLVLVIALGTQLMACTRKAKAPPTGGTGQPVPAAGTVEQVPALVADYLAQGSRSPDGLWVAAAVPASGDAQTAGLWVAAADLTGVRRVATEMSATAGPPIWTPRGTLLYADPAGTWYEISPADWQAREFAPGLLKGKNASIRPDAFSPDGSQFVYTLRDGEHTETWLASSDGKNIRHLGTDVTAGWVGGELNSGPAGK